MSFDPTLHAAAAGTVAGAASATGATPAPVGTGGKALTAFEGFLKTAGHILGVVLADIVKFVVPVVQIAAVADPAAAPAVAAFTTSLKLVEAAVVSAQQRWAAEGSAANAQKLADVLETVEGPITLLFAQAGIAVDTGYVINLVNGVVAILNAQPGVVLTAVSK